MSKFQTLSTRTRTQGLIIGLLLSGLVLPVQARIKPLEAGPISNAQHAQQKCPALAKENNAVWTGKWWGIASGNMAVCEVDMLEREYEAGLIRNQQEAAQKCPQIARRYPGASWNGKWRTVVGGQVSVCQFNLGTREIEAGYIRNQQEAALRCKAVALQQYAEWTGRWRTPPNSSTSLCEVQM
ncbi:MAG TPA: mannan-binding lectin [Thiolinea sp.]|nr:mannan-binding lectin [Thiolinea sp.]